MTSSENTPLLNSNIDDKEFDVRAEVKTTVRRAVPMVMTYLLEHSIIMVSLLLVGQKLGKEKLASVSLASLTTSITGFAVIGGMATALDTYCAQAYGAGKYDKVGLYFQRGTCLVFIFMIPMWFVWWNSEFFLGLVIPEKQLLHDTQTYLRISSLGMPGLIFFETGKRFFQAQGEFDATTYCVLATLPIDILLGRYWVNKYGFVGAPMALAFSYWCISFLMLSFAYYQKMTKCWTPITREVFQNWGPMFKLGVAGVIMIESDYLSYELLTIMSTRFGTDAIAAQSIISFLSTFTYLVLFGISVVLSTRVAHFIGMGSVKSAKKFIILTYWISLVCGAVMTMIFFFGKRPLARLFTKEESVIKVVCHVVPLVSISKFYEAFGCFTSAILRAQGRQNIGSVLNLVCFYIIGLPIGYVLAFWFDLELIGIWGGWTVGTFVLGVATIYYIAKSNWDQILKDAKSRTN